MQRRKEFIELWNKSSLAENEWQTLPATVWLEIFSYLNPYDLAAMMAVNNTFNHYGKTPAFWEKNLLSIGIFYAGSENISHHEIFATYAKGSTNRHQKLALWISENNIESLIKNLHWDDLFHFTVRGRLIELILEKNNTELFGFVFNELYYKKSPKPLIRPLHWLAMFGATSLLKQHITQEKFKISLETFNKIINSRYNLLNDATPLFLAAKYGRTKTAKILIEAGADVHLSIRGKTSLYIAAENGHFDTVQLLLNNGAKMDTQTEHFRYINPFYIACKNGYIGIAKLLLTKSDENTIKCLAPFQTAIELKNCALFKWLLENGFDITADNEGKFSLLYSAVGHANDIVKLLVERKDIDINRGWLPAGYTSGHTPLFKAVFLRDKKVVKTLCLHDADVNLTPMKPIKLEDNSQDEEENEIEEYSDATPLFVAAENGDLEIVKILLAQKNVNVDAMRQGGETALSIAAKNDHQEIVEAIKEYKKQIKKAEMSSSKLTLDFYANHKRKELENLKPEDPKSAKKQKKLAYAESLQEAVKFFNLFKQQVQALKQQKDVLNESATLKRLQYQLLKK